jgi:UV DNA damage endonuclease
MRLGVATRLLGAPLRSQDSRRWAQQPHLSVSLAYVRDILAWLQRQQIGMYRLSGNLAPYATHPDFPAFHRQRQECRRELAAIGDQARAAAIRLTMHPAAYVRLDAADEALAQRSQRELTFVAALMDDMGLGEESVIVVHAAGGKRVVSESGISKSVISQGRSTDSLMTDSLTTDSLARFARRFDALPAHVRSRLALENGDRTCALQDALWVHRRTGIAVVFDLLHHRCNNPGGMELTAALGQTLATWPAHVRPKVHLSSPRTELRLLRRAEGTYPAAPLAHQHSDFINVFDAIELLRAAALLQARAFDIMIEAKAHDLALLRLREQLAHYAPHLASRVW